MKLRSHQIILIAFGILYLAARIFFSLQSDYFNSDSSYFALREIEHISTKGMPIIHDTLSYSGHDFVFMPFYFYFLAFFTKVFPEVIAIKIINNILASLLVPAVFLCVHKMTKNSTISVSSAVVASLSPFYISMTLNDISLYSVVIPGCFFLFYLFMRLDEDIETLNYLIPVTLAVVLTSSSVFIMLVSLGIFFIITYVEKIEVKKVLLEFFSFFVLFFFWTNFILYKTAFLKNGFSIISGNIPDTVRQYFSIDIFQTFLSVGLITSILGIYTVYLYISGKKWKDVVLFISFFFSVLGLFLLSFIELNLAMPLLSIALIILSSKAVIDIVDLLEKSKIAAHSKKIFFGFIALLVIIQGLPGIMAIPNTMKDSIQKGYASDLMWMRNNTPVNSTIAATVDEGNMIAYFTGRKNIADTNYLLADNPKDRISDIDRIFKSVLKVESIKILEKYNSDYILFSGVAKKEYNISQIGYVNDKCFNVMLNSTVIIYRKNESCRLKTYEN